MIISIEKRNPDLQEVLRCIWEITRCIEEQKFNQDLGGPILGEVDWRTELWYQLDAKMIRAKKDLISFQ